MSIPIASPLATNNIVAVEVSGGWYNTYRIHNGYLDVIAFKPTANGNTFAGDGVRSVYVTYKT